LLVPLYSSGVLVNLQRIAPDGGKRFLFGADQGRYSPLGIITPAVRFVSAKAGPRAPASQSGYAVAAP
jgi:putative DNA primase/helicase